MKQRLRWAVGAAQVLMKFFGQMFRWRKRRMWGIYLEYFVSVFWAYLIIFNIIVWLLNLSGLVPVGINVPTLVPYWHGIMLGITCLLQVLVSLFLDRRYDRGLLSIYVWMIWYPFFYWILNMATVVVAVPKVLFGRKRRRATWVSPDRGVR